MGASDADRALVLSERLWAELIAPALLGRGNNVSVESPSAKEKKALRRFYHHAVQADVSLEHITDDAARGFVQDKWAARCDKLCCSLLCLKERGEWLPLSSEKSGLLQVASVGGGPGNDACGAFLFAAIVQRWQRVEAQVFDFSPVWRPYCEAIADPDLLKSALHLLTEGGTTPELALSFHEADLRAPSAAVVNERVLAETSSMDLFLFSHVTRESQACRHELLPTLLRRSQPGAIFIFLDMYISDMTEVQDLVRQVEQEDLAAAVDVNGGASSAVSRFKVVRVGCSEERYAFSGLAACKLSPGEWPPEQESCTDHDQVFAVQHPDTSDSGETATCMLHWEDTLE